MTTLLSPNFTLEELTHTDHREFTNEPNDLEKNNLKRLAELLEQVKGLLGGKPIMVNSGFRSKQVNDAVGSSDRSQHRVGAACDFRVPSMTPNDVVKAIIASDIPFDQIIREFDRWTHISVPNEPTGKPRRQALIIDKMGTRTYS
jgi:triacylglycerol esterase/lipase EstA (alpha/beta hydrolase family)